MESYNWDLLRRFVAAEDTDGQISMDSVGVEDTAEQLNRLIDIGETMARKYWVTVTNPPYRGISDVDVKLQNFAKEKYPNSKADLSTICMERAFAMTCHNGMIATVYKGNIIKNLIMDCQSYTKYRPNETTGGIFVSWRRKEELPTGA